MHVRFTHQPALDGLRGVAVLGVLLFHGGLLPGGYLGVDAFFVLSGYLITSLLLVEVASSGRVALGRFWIRRLRRLMPAALALIVAVALVWPWLVPGDDAHRLRHDALATLFYVANWRQIVSANDYFDVTRAPSPLHHTWSLAIEEQFYVLWPLLVAAIARAAPAAAATRTGAAAVGLAATSVAVAQGIFDEQDPSRVYFGTDTRAASILFGSALAA